MSSLKGDMPTADEAQQNPETLTGKTLANLIRENFYLHDGSTPTKESLEIMEFGAYDEEVLNRDAIHIAIAGTPASGKHEIAVVAEELLIETLGEKNVVTEQELQDRFDISERKDWLRKHPEDPYSPTKPWAYIFTDLNAEGIAHYKFIKTEKKASVLAKGALNSFVQGIHGHKENRSNLRRFVKETELRGIIENSNSIQEIVDNPIFAQNYDAAMDLLASSMREMFNPAKADQGGTLFPTPLANLPIEITFISGRP